MTEPRKCPKCDFEQPGHHAECMKCGLIFAKYRPPANDSDTNAPVSEEKSSATSGIMSFMRQILFYVPPEINPISYAGRILLFVILLIWGLIFIFTPMETNAVGKSFWHLVNTPFHEAGHIIFRPFGRFITSLGGTLGQLLMPLICMLTFLIKTGDTFGASVTLWWFGENFMDIAPYINDARAGVLPLLGGNTGQTSPYGFHDWEFILTETGLLLYDHFLANLSYATGIALMLLSFAWGGFILRKQYRLLDSFSANSS